MKLKTFAHKMMIVKNFTGKVKELEAGKWKMKKKSSLYMQKRGKEKTNLSKHVQGTKLKQGYAFL